MTTHERAFEGLELGETSGNLLKEELLKVVQKRLKTNDVQIFVEFGAKIGDNFNGEIYRVYFKRTDDDDAKKTSLILKSAPKNMARREKLNVRVLFLREIMLYDDVLSTFYNFQISKGVIPSENGFNEYPKCYKSISEFLYETVLLEDLKLRNFDLINHRTEPITFDHMSLLLKALGKFHAISFALKDQQPKKFKELSSVIFEPYWTIIEQPAVKQILVGMLGRMRSCLEEENRLDLVEKFEKLTGDDFRSKFYDLFQSTKAEPYAVICHGDLTVKNTMFRKDKQGKPVEIQFFDWQYSRYASPVTDVALYLFCCSSSELRAKHYDEFLKIYHGSLSDLLKRLGSDPQKVFSYEVMKEEFKKFGSYGIFVGSILVPLLNTDIETMPDFDFIAEHAETMNVSEYMFPISEEARPEFNKRIVGLFDDMAQFGYI